jgi:excisionase family DNA binding protein
MPDEILTVEEAATILKISAFTVRKYLREQKLEGKKVGKEWRILRSSLMKAVTN